MKYLFFAFLVTSSFSSTDPLSYFPNCKSFGPQLWRELHDYSKEILQYAVDKPNIENMSLVMSFRNKTRQQRDICQEIKDLFGDDFRLTKGNKGKVLILSDNYNKSRFQIELDIAGQYYKIYEISRSRGKKQYVDYNFNQIGDGKVKGNKKNANPKARNTWDFYIMSTFDYTDDAEAVFMDKSFFDKLPGPVSRKLTNYNCKNKFYRVPVK